MIWMHKRCEMNTRSYVSQEFPYDESILKIYGESMTRTHSNSKVGDGLWCSRISWTSSDLFLVDGDGTAKED